MAESIMCTRSSQAAVEYRWSNLSGALRQGIFSLVLLCFVYPLVLKPGFAQETNPIERLGLGRELLPEELDTLSQTVFASGSGLPNGRGTAVEGFAIYAESCAVCHGGRGEGGRALELVGDRSLLSTEFPDRGIAVYWPYAPTLFNYIQRSMPPDQPYSLSDNEVYSVIAALLVMNGLLETDAPLDAATLSALKMPNRDGFSSLHDHPPID